MTMLDRMRRHKNWLKWSLAIVVVAFVLLYIPNFLRNGLGARRRQARATSSPRSTGRTSPSASSGASTSSRCRRYRRAYGGNIDERLLKQMGIDRRILAAADRRGSRRWRRPTRLGHHDQRRGGARADPRRCPRSRRTASSSATTRYRQLLQMSEPAAARRPSSRRRCAAA